MRACLTLEFDDFHDLYPHRKWNAYRFKRARLIEKGAVIPTETALSSAKPEPREEDWEALFSALESAEATRHRLSPTDEVAHITAPGNAPFGVAVMSDLHIGASGVDYARLREDIDLISRTDGLGVIVNGDLWENSKPQMKSGNALYHSLFSSPREQYYYARTRFSPIKEKILAITQGNHDARDAIVAGIDRLPDLCRELNTHYFTERGGTIYLTVGDQEYVIVAKHEYGGSSKTNKSNRARRLWEEWPHSWENADVVTVGHLHEPDMHVTMRRGQPVYFAQSGSYKLHDSYSESHGYRPSYGVPLLVFYPDRRKIVPFTDMEDGITFLRLARAKYRVAQEYGAA